MPVWMQVVSAFALVGVVLWWMWKVPVGDDPPPAWTPILAFVSAWCGLLALLFSAALWLLPAPDLMLVVVMLGLEPGALTTGILVLWLLRAETIQEQMRMQQLQARVGVGLALIAVAVTYLFVMTEKTPFTAVGG